MDRIEQEAKTKRAPIILIIDEDREEVKLLKNYFKKEGFRCVAASDGIRGIIHILNDKPDLIVMELALPRLSGYEVIKRLQRISEHTRSIPVVILSAKRLDEETKKRLIDLEENVVEYVSKPITRGAFMVKIHRILKTGVSEGKIIEQYKKERRNE